MRTLGRYTSVAVISVSFLLSGGVQAGTLLGLKQVQISAGSQVDLLFDGKVSKSQLKTEFFNDIIQISLADTSVYPAKISSVNGTVLTKVFAYQYAPKLVRCRLSVKGKAENYKDHVRVIPNGKMLTVRFDDAITGNVVTDRMSTRSAQVNRVNSGSEKTVDTAKISDPDERSLLERVLKGDEKGAADKIAEKPVAIEKPLQVERVEKEKNEKAANKPLASGGKSFMSPMQVMGRLAILGGVLALILYGLRRFLKGNNALSRLAKNSLGKKKLIEVLSTHHLGPKKSIAVVKVAGRMLVVGITNESINLIAQLNNQENPSDAISNMDLSGLEDLGDLGLQMNTSEKVNRTTIREPAVATAPMPVSSAEGVFASFLDSEASKPATYGAPLKQSKLNTAQNTPAPTKVSPSNNVRAQIRNRLEGLKQL